MASENIEEQMDFEASEIISRQDVEDSNTTDDSKSEQAHQNETNSSENETPKVDISNEKMPGHSEKKTPDKPSYDNKLENDVLEMGNENEGKEEEKYNNGKCEPCLFDEIEEDAIAFCVVCIEYLCKGCARDHRRNKSTRSHKVLDENKMPKDPSIFKMMKVMTACTEHPEMEVSYKCEKHDRFICSACLAVNHRKCEEVTEVSKVQKYSIDGDAEASLPGMLQTAYDMTVSVRIAKEENIKQIHLDKASIAKERSQYIESLHEHLLKLIEQSKKETENILTTELSSLQENVDKCTNIENQEIEYKKLLDVAINYGSTVEWNVISALVKKEVEDLKDETKKQEAKMAARLKFERNQSFSDVATIGKVFVLRGDENEAYQGVNARKQMMIEQSSDVIDETSSDDGESLHEGSLMRSVVSRTRIMHNIHQTIGGVGFKCSVTSMLVLSDGRVVVTDYDNETIRLLNLDLFVEMECSMDGEPIDMCQTSRDQLAVICDGKKMVNKYIVAEDKIYNYAGFPSKLYPISIEKSNENDSHLIILFSDEQRNNPKRSDSKTVEIQIRSLHTGAIIKQFTDFKAKSSNKMILENPSRIRVMPKVQDAFLVSDNKKVHCFDIHQSNTKTIKERWYYKSYKRSIIDDITDIAVDREGNIYFCGKSSKNVHQISGSNFMHNRVLLSVSSTPLSICVDDERRRLFVGCENDGFIYAVELE